LAAFGYNRDGKKGKQQMVIGLLTGPEGAPAAVRVFAGNTQDPKTVTEQIRQLLKTGAFQMHLFESELADYA